MHPEFLSTDCCHNFTVVYSQYKELTNKQTVKHIRTAPSLLCLSVPQCTLVDRPKPKRGFNQDPSSNLFAAFVDQGFFLCSFLQNRFSHFFHPRAPTYGSMTTTCLCCPLSSGWEEWIFAAGCSCTHHSHHPKFSEHSQCGKTSWDRYWMQILLVSCRWHQMSWHWMIVFWPQFLEKTSVICSSSFSTEQVDGLLKLRLSCREISIGKAFVF